MNEKFFDDLDELRDKNLNLEIEIVELQKEVYECKKALRLLQSFKVTNLEAKKRDNGMKEKLKKEIESLKEIINDIPVDYSVDGDSISDKIKRIMRII